VDNILLDCTNKPTGWLAWLTDAAAAEAEGKRTFETTTKIPTTDWSGRATDQDDATISQLLRKVDAPPRVCVCTLSAY